MVFKAILTPRLFKWFSCFTLKHVLAVLQVKTCIEYSVCFFTCQLPRTGEAALVNGTLMSGPTTKENYGDPFSPNKSKQSGY